MSRRIHQAILRGGGGATLLLGLAVFCSAALAQNISITPGTVHQTVRGFGGMNAPGWINDLTTAQVEKAYGSGEGQLGLSIMRMRIDPNSAAWNLQVPAAKRAKELGATLFASPWSPPAHMKSNKSLINGGKLLPEYYSAYTTHLLDFANYMSRNSAPLYAISIQNEPDWHPDYESCDWTGAEFANYLTTQGSRFGDLKVIAPESLGFNTKYADPILNSATAAPHVDIIGGHLYGVLPKDYPLARQKGKEIWMTEHYTESKNSGDAWPLALDVGTELHQSMVANYNAYVWWYVRRSYGLLLENGNVSKRGYIMSQYARFVRPGSKRIGATEKPYADVLSTAYLRPDNKIVLVVVNQGTSQRQLNVSLPGRTGSFVKYSTSGTLNVGYGGSYKLSSGATSFWVEPQSVATFLLEDTASSSSSASSASSAASSAASSVITLPVTSSSSSSVSSSVSSANVGKPTGSVLAQSGNHNPVISHIYTADPAARVFNGRMYLLADRDMEGQTSHSQIQELHLFSSDDMVNWQDHGMVLKPAQSTKWATMAWAPDFIARNGKYYIYFSNGAGSIGVAVADKLEGPYTDPLGRALITKSTPNANVDWVFDPSVFIDDDGQAYLYFGGGGPGNARVIKLNADMISTSGSAITLDVPYFFEALQMHKKNGTYYLSYSTNPANGMRIDYMTSKSPTSGFVHRGTVMAQPWQNSNNNNHATITEYNGQGYIFYHNRALSNERAGGNVMQRSVNVDRLYFNADGSIRQVTSSATGVPALKTLDAFLVKPAELYHKESGIKTEPASEGTQALVMTAGSWVRLANVDFGNGGATGFAARIAATGSGSIQVILGNLNNTPVGTLAVSSTGNLQTWQDRSTAISKVSGVHDVYLRATGNVQVQRHWFVASAPAAAASSSSQASVSASSQASVSSSSQASVASSSSSSRASSASSSVAAGQVEVAYHLSSEWAAGFCGVVTIRNPGSSPVTRWSGSFNLPGGKITQLWNANWTQNGSTVTVSSQAWSGAIAAGATITTPGFCAERTSSNASSSVASSSVSSSSSSAAAASSSAASSVPSTGSGGVGSSASSASSAAAPKGVLEVGLSGLSSQAMFAPLRVRTDAAAANKAYVEWPNNGANQSLATPANDAAGQVELAFVLAQASAVQFDIEANFANAEDDSFYFKLNGGAWQTFNNATTAGWQTLPVASLGNLAAGRHVLTLLRREDGAKLGKVVLSAAQSSISRATPVAYASPNDVANLFKLASFPIGVAVSAGNEGDSLLRSGTRAAAERALTEKHFNSLVAGNIMKMSYLHPAENTYTFTQADALADYAKSKGMVLHGHALVWHADYQVPNWMKNYTGDWTKMLEAHVTNVAKHYAGKVVSWDVVNEALADGNATATKGFRATDSIFYQKMGSGFIETAFKAARAADPNADLYYNDYGMDGGGSKFNYCMAMVDDFQKRGIPIDGVGFQMHINIDWPSPAQMRAVFGEVVKRGLKVRISELDIPVNATPGRYSSLTATASELQKKKYREVVAAYLDVVPPELRGGITVWGLSDNGSWLVTPAKPDWPLLFDADLKAKDALSGFADALRGVR